MVACIVEVYKIMRYIDKVNGHDLFPREGEYNTRGHRFKERGERFGRALRCNVYIQRKVSISCRDGWNYNA